MTLSASLFTFVICTLQSFTTTVSPSEIGLFLLPNSEFGSAENVLNVVGVIVVLPSFTKEQPEALRSTREMTANFKYCKFATINP
jgi:hypothetical protein